MYNVLTNPEIISNFCVKYECLMIFCIWCIISKLGQKDRHTDWQSRLFLYTQNTLFMRDFIAGENCSTAERAYRDTEENNNRSGSHSYEIS